MKRAITSIILATQLLFSCKVSNASPLQQEFKDDAYFFMALQAADEEDDEKAMRYFKISRDSENSSPIIARRSAESLTMLGNVLERNEASTFLAEKYKDDSALLISAREFFKQNEFATILKITEHIDLATAPNELVKLRFDSMLEKRDSRFDQDFYTWCVSRPLSIEHLQIYEKYIAPKKEAFESEKQALQDEYDHEILVRQEAWKKEWAEKNPGKELDESKVPTKFDGLKLEEIEYVPSDEQTVIDFRILIYHKKYDRAFSAYKKIVEIYEKNATSSDGKQENLAIEDHVISDIGKALLYGTDDYYYSARQLDKLAKKLDKEKSYYAYFYCARLYDKGGRYQKTAADRFKSALDATEDPEKFDNGLWYLLNFQLRTSTNDIIDTLKSYGSKINDPEYFDDFFESLSVLLLSAQKWQDFYQVWKETDSNFSERTAGKYAYISGRLIEEGLAKGAQGLKTRQSVDAFMKVLSGKGDTYYKVCALERLNITDREIVESVILNAKKDESETEDGKEDKKAEEEIEENSGADILMRGYAAFGFPQRVYAEWIMNRKDISTDVSLLASDFLFECGLHDSTYNVQSLRIASRAKQSAKGKISKDLMKRVYPTFYSDLIKKACEENELPEYIFYALVRTESFFDPSISSVAGASGLSQLMEATAKDEARKLKMDEDFDILDPETNLRMGSHYLKSLITRVDENIPILALFAYNGGLTNVRKWIRSAQNDWSTLGKAAHKPAGISMDLFLETLPFTETRDYGRQLVASSAMYAWLYYGKTPSATVREILYAD